MFNIISEAQNLQEEIVQWRRHIHQHPEVGMDLKDTVDFVCSKLDSFDVVYERLNDYGVVASVKGYADGKTVAIRADMDALTSDEESGLSFQSVNNGKAHLCGHDGHTAMLLGAAKLLNLHRDVFEGTVKLIFQPGEEIGLGAKTLIEEHDVLLDVEAIFGLHLTTPAPTGYIFYTEGPSQASMAKFDIEIIGAGAHGAMPHSSIDPIVIASELVSALQTIVSRNIDPAVPAVVTIGMISGGTAFNIIPDSVKLKGTFRAIKSETTQMIQKRIEALTNGICNAYSAENKMDFQILTPALENPKNMMDIAVESAAKIVGDHIINNTEPIMAGEDFAFYMQKVPGCFISLGAGSIKDGCTYPMHNPKVKFNEDVFWIGTALHVQVALDMLSADTII